MKVILESTDKVIELKIGNAIVPARLWEGVTAGGIKCHAFITRIAVHKDDDAAEFEKALQEQHAALSPELHAVYDMRQLVL